MRHLRIQGAVAAMLLALCATGARAAVPGSVSIEGVLLTNAGGPVSDGLYKVTFRLYEKKAGGKAVWSETADKLPVKGGAFQHLLGSVVKLSPATVDAAKVAWLAIAVGSDPELPRNPLHAVPFALRAAVAEAADFTYAGSKTKGGPASDLQCTGCVGVAEMAFDADVNLGGHGLKAKAVTASTVNADTVAAKTFVGDGSKLTGLKVPAGKCKTGEAVVGIQPDGSLLCASAASSLPADALDNVSNGQLTNEFTDVVKSAKAVPIPDNNPIGVASALIVPDLGIAKKLTVSVKVSNSSFGSVEVVLFAPDASKYTLFSKDAKTKLLQTSYPVPTKPVSGDLLAWKGKNPKGKWTLKAMDTGFKDNKTDGAIESWSIAIETLSTKKTDSKGLLTTSGGLQMQVSAAHPAPCDAGSFGRMYLNSKDNKLYVCRTSWDAVLFADCGNGIKEFPEECDDGNQNSNKPGACRPDCKKPVCGDKIVDPNEQCDDGNKNNADDCKNDCTLTCKGWPYKGICLMHKKITSNADSIPAGCTPYQPGMNWNKTDFVAICTHFSKIMGWTVGCSNPDMDADGGLCTNFQAIASWEGPTQNNTPDVWLRNPTFNWKPVNGSQQNCNLNSYPTNTVAIYACK